MTRIPEKGLREKVADLLSKLSKEEPRLGCRKSIGPMMPKPNPFSLKAFIEFIDRNLNDLSWFRVSAKLSEEAIQMLNSLLGNPGGKGIITYGGSESNLTSLYIARELGAKTVITSSSAHTSVFKAAKILNLNVVKAGTDQDLRVMPDEIAKLANEVDNPVIVLTAGNTETGGVDDVEAVSELVPDVPIIIDGAFGGVMIPFLRLKGWELPKADFTVNSVISVSIDGHKTLMTPIPSGALLLRDEKLMEIISFPSNYLSSGLQYGLLWTRTAGSAAALWASLKYYGMDGLAELFDDMMRNALYARELLLDLGFKVSNPDLPILCFRHPHISTGELRESMLKKGWYLYLCPSLSGMKITFMPHVTRDVVNDLIEDLSSVMREMS